MEIKVRIKGISPLMMNVFKNEYLAEKPKVIKGKESSPREEARGRLYLSKDKKHPIIPGEVIMAGIREAGKFHKYNGRSKVTTRDTSLVPAGIFISELECPLRINESLLGADDFEVDSRAIRNQNNNARVMCNRPRFDEWECEYTLDVDTELFDPSLVRALVDDSGKKLGLMSYRPQCKGPFGRFVVIKWEEEQSEISS